MNHEAKEGHVGARLDGLRLTMEYDLFLPLGDVLRRPGILILFLASAL